MGELRTHHLSMPGHADKHKIAAQLNSKQTKQQAEIVFYRTDGTR